MALFNYTPTKEMAQVTPVNFTAQPNQSFSRAIQNLQQAAELGVQLKGTLDKEQYDKDLIAFEEKKGVFNTRWESSDYNTRLNVLIPELQETFLAPYKDKDNKYARALYKQAVEMSNAYYSQTAREGVVDRHRDNEVDLLNELIAHEASWDAATTAAEKEKLLEGFDEAYITPYADNNSPQAQALLLKSMSYKAELTKSLTALRVREKDDTIKAETTAIISTNIEAAGVITQDLWKDIVTKASGISDFNQNKTGYLAAFANHAMNSMIVDIDAELSKPNPTHEKFLELTANVKAFAKVQPNIKGTDTYKQLQNVLQAFDRTVTENTLRDIDANIGNDNVPTSVVEEQLNELLGRNAVTKEYVDYKVFDKEQRIVEKKVAANIAGFITNGDMGGLSKLIDAGKSNTVQRMVGVHLEKVIAAAAEGGADVKTTLDAYFTERRRYEDGIGKSNIPKSEAIDAILKTSRDGTIVDPEGLRLFMDTYETAVKDNGYSATGSTSNMQADYLVLKGLFALGREDIVREFQQSQSGQSPTLAKQNEMWDTIVQNDERLTFDLHPMAMAQLKKFFGPSLKALSKAGLEPETVTSEIQSFVQNHFIRAQATGGGKGRILLPKGDFIKTEDNYASLIESINYRADVTKPQASADYTQSRETVAVPKDFDNPNGNWIVYHANGVIAKELTPDEVESLVFFGTAYKFDTRMVKKDGTTYPTIPTN